MPSWSHSLSQEHQWTNRKLIGDDESSDEDDGSADEQVISDLEFLNLEGTSDKRHMQAGLQCESSKDFENYTVFDVDRAGLSTSFQPHNSVRTAAEEAQESFVDTRFHKRTLLTTEEMEDSDQYDERWEDGDVSEDDLMNESCSSGKVSPSSPDYQQNDLTQRDDEQDYRIDLHGATENQNDPALDCPGYTQLDVDRQETPNSTIDSGRMEGVVSTPTDLSSSPVAASKRRKKAIKYLEHIILDLLRQLVAITKLQLRQVRSEIGEGDGSESESENEEPDDNGFDKPSTVDEANAAIEEEGKGLPNISIPLLNRATGNLKYLKFPGKPGRLDTSALSLARLLRVCELLHHALVQDIVVTKRDIYYKDVNLFGKQIVVDALIDDIVASVGLKRMDFNVVASPKGLVASSGLNLLMKNDEKKTVSATPTIIPSNGEIIEIQSVAPPRWALIIEKEATFTTLCKTGILADEALGNGLLVTGKGYPDLATLHFLKMLSESFPDCLIGILVDADPHGLDILSVYRYGSKKMRYTAETEGLALGAKAEWLGVKATEWSRLNIDVDKLIPISEKDVQFAESMLQEDDLPMDWKRELVHMLHMRRKAEIQILGGIAAIGRFDGSQFSGPVAGRMESATSEEEPVAKPTSPPNESSGEGLQQHGDLTTLGDRAASVESSNNTPSPESHDKLYDYVKGKLYKMLHRTLETGDEMDI